MTRVAYRYKRTEHAYDSDVLPPMRLLQSPDYLPGWELVHAVYHPSSGVELVWRCQVEIENG